MKNFKENFWGGSKYWWLMLIVGILLILGGFAYWIWPFAGFAVASQIFGWLLVLAGVVQLVMVAGPHQPHSWGWWLFGGVADLFIGFMLVRNIVLSEEVFPYFLALIFAYWGVTAIVSAFSARTRKFWWLYLINGILMLVISYFFVEAGYVQEAMMISFLTSIAFIYWGFSLAAISYDMRPSKELQD